MVHAETDRPTPRPAARVRRRPRLTPFAVAGVLLGIALAGLVTVLGPSSALYSPGRSFGFLAVFFGAVGLVLGGIGYLLADAASRRRR